MARRFLTNLDLSKNELQNARVQNLAVAPGSPVAGQIYYATGTNAIQLWNGTAWVALSTGTVSDATTTSKGIVQLAQALTGTAAAPDITTGYITNTHISGTAGITYAKLALGGNVVNADISPTAAIALSKLATDPLARANHTGTQLSATISDLTTTVQAYRLDQFAAPTAPVSLNSQRITNLLDPTGAQDAATRNYVDNAITGLDAKASTVAATTGAETFTIAAGAVTQIAGTTIDGTTPAIGNRILIKDAPLATGVGSANSNQPGNGIYTVTANTTNLTVARATDQDAWSEVPNAYVWVEQGTTNADTGWVVTSNPGGTLNTTGIQWSMFTASTTIQAGSGLTKAGNTISISNLGVTNAMIAASTIDLTTKVTGALPIANGGTGQTTQQTALNALAGAVTTAQYLRGNGANVTMSAIQAADVPTLNQNTTGTAANVTGTVGIGNGGTGQTTAKAARETGLIATGYYSAATNPAATSWSITQATHGLRATRGLIVQLNDEASGDQLEADISVAATGDVTIAFAAAPTANSVRATIVG